MTSIYKIPEEPDTSNLERQIRFYTRFAWGIVILGLIIGVLYFIIPNNSCFKDFGDYTGGVVASLWSLAGLFIIYVAFLGQKKEIKLQQYEIKLNRIEIKQSTHELKGQKQQMVQQNETIKKQQFEHGFFSLLNLLNEIGRINKRESFKAIARRYLQYSKDENGNGLKKVLKDDLDRRGYIFDHFFNNFFSVITFIDKNDLELLQRNYYINIVFSQLSNEEFFLLSVYYSLINNPSEKPNFSSEIKELIEKYCLLRNLLHTDYFDVIKKIDFYNRESYDIEYNSNFDIPTN